MEKQVGKKTILIDDIDWDLYFPVWHICGVYAVYRPTILGRRIPSISMHRMIMERKLGRKLEKGEIVDHINCNGLDNRRSNLRLASPTENSRNHRFYRRRMTGGSEYKGINFNAGKWTVRIYTGNGESVYLGRYKREIDAARAYDAGARKYFGDFANLNFPEGTVDGEDRSIGTGN